MNKQEHTFDLIVIGTGTAASTTASECSSAGWSVAIIDSLPFGGTCALRGCDPKKVLVEAAKVIDSNQRHENKGIIGSEAVHIKWPDLITFKRTFTDPFPKNREDGYIRAGIVPFHGHAQFISPTTVKVEVHKDSNNNTILNGRHILIATGSKPMNLNIPGSENIITSDQFLELRDNNLPDRIVFVGGGYISFEFAHIAARAGAKVTIIHRGKRPLEHFDPDLVNRLVQRSRDIGIDVILQAAVKSIDKSSSSSTTTTNISNEGRNKLVVHYYSSSSSDLSKENKQKSDDDMMTSSSTAVESDMVVHGAGREPNIDGLNLADVGGVQYTHRGITVNEYLQSVSNPAVYAAGDVVANMGLPLTPVASYDGSVVATNLIKGNTLKSNYTGLPSVVFTIPPLVSVGMQEKEAKDQRLRFKIKHEDTSGWASSRRVGETCAAFKVLIEEDTNRILGAHILGPHAEEIINIFSLAIRLGLTTKDLNDPILYTYPTNSSDILYML
jgi:glutathione reductase (NADPH)